MIFPDDWKEYSWFVDTGNGDALAVRLDWRVWQVSAIAGAAGGTILMGNLVTIPAGAAWTGWPAAMYVGPVQFAGVTAWTVEWIRRNIP